MTNGYMGRDLETLAELPNYYDWIVDVFGPWLAGYTLEIGAGIGTIATRIVDDVERLDLVEPSINLPRLMPGELTDNPKVSVVTETLEQRLPPPGRYRIVSPDDELAIDTFAQAARADYRKEFEQRKNELEAFCRRYGVHLMPMSTSDDPVATLQLALGRRTH